MEHGLLKARVLRCALIAILAALLPLTALADFVNVSGTDVVTISTAAGAEEFAVDFGTVCAGSNASKTVQLAIAARSHADPGGTIFVFADGSLVTLAVASTTGSGLGATIAPPSAILLPANWTALPDGTLSASDDSTLTLNTATLGAFTGTVVYSASGTNAAGGQLTKFSTLDVKANVVTCGTPPSAQFAPTQTTCQNFRDGTASSLSAINYHLKNGAINNVAPGVAFYYVKLNAPAAGGTFTISVNQSDNGSTPAFGAQQVLVYSIDCNRYSNVSTTTSNGNTTITVNGAAANQPFIVSVKVDPSPVVGSATPSPTTVTYTYVTLVNGTTVPGSSQSIALAPGP